MQTFTIRGNGSLRKSLIFYERETTIQFSENEIFDLEHGKDLISGLKSPISLFWQTVSYLDLKVIWYLIRIVSSALEAHLIELNRLSTNNAEVMRLHRLKRC